MSNTLSGLTPAQTFQGLIKVGNNTNVDGTAKVLSDGSGNNLPMEVSTSGVNFTGTLTQNGLPITTTPSGVSGAIQFSDGSAFASDAANLFWDDTNNRLGIGTNAPSSDLHILGKTNTNVRSLQVQNLQNRGILSTTNDGYVQIGDFSAQGYSALMAFIRPSGASRATTFEQTNSNLTITNINGNVTFNNTPVTIKGSGSTSATTSLLVQNSASANLLSVLDNGNVGIGTNAPTEKIEVNGNIRVSANAFVYSSAGGGAVSSGMRFDSATPKASVFVGSSERVIFGNSTVATIKGSGTTSATTALLVQNSAGSDALQVRDDRVIICAGMPTSSAGLPSGALYSDGGTIKIV